MNLIIIVFRFIFSHKWKIVLATFLCGVFVFLLFPFSDLNDFISSKIYQVTGNRIYIQFDKMDINPLTASIQLENISVDTAEVDGFSIDQLTASPSFMALIRKQAGGTLQANGILKGQMTLKISPSGKSQTASAAASTDPEIQKSLIELSAQKISLKELRNTFNLPIAVDGQLDLNLSADVDPVFMEQPEGDLILQIQKFELPASTINLPDLGSLNLPEVKLSSIELRGRLQNGKFTIETGRIGSPADDFSGLIKGEIGLVIKNLNGQIFPMVNSYNLSLDLTAQPNFKSRASFFLNFIDQYKKDLATGSRYQFKLLSTAPGMPPQFSPMN